MQTNNRIILVLILISSVLLRANSGQAFNNNQTVKFSSEKAQKFYKQLKVGQSELLEFSKPVTLVYYDSGKANSKYISLEKLQPSHKGYNKFLIKALAAGTSELTFSSGNELTKISVLVSKDYSNLENELNRLFGIKNSSEDKKIKVLAANLVSNLNQEFEPHIYLKGKVTNAKNAMLAVAFAANAVGDQGVKIFSNPGGQLRFKDLESQSQATSPRQNNNSSFVEFYESTNKLIDTNNLHRDLVLASKNEKVISYIQIQEPKRFAIKVRFLEMDSRFVDDFISSISSSSNSNDVCGSAGTTNIGVPTINRATGLGSGKVVDALGSSGIARLSEQIVSGSLVSGTVKLIDNVFLNINVNDLLQEGALRIVNEFSLITHSGETVSLGKGTRFPIPKLNNSLANSSISVEYIPIGFKGELKVTGLENKLIDVQLASRLSSAESTTTSISGINIPIFNEEYVNSGALLKDGQEIVLNAFLTETEKTAKSSSPLGRLIPFLGSSKTKRRSKDLLFIAIQAEEILPSSSPIKQDRFNLPRIDIQSTKNLYAKQVSKLRKLNVTDTIDLAELNSSKTNKVDFEPSNIDPLDIQGEL